MKTIKQQDLYRNNENSEIKPIGRPLGKPLAQSNKSLEQPLKKPLAKPRTINTVPKTVENKTVQPLNDNREVQSLRPLSKPQPLTPPKSSFTAQAKKEPLTKSYEPIKEENEVKEVERPQQPLPKYEEQPHQNSQNIPNTSNSQNNHKITKDYKEEERVNKRTETPTQSSKYQHLKVSEFYCKYFDLIKEVIDNVLTQKYGSKIAKGIENEKIRKEVEADSFDEVRDYIIMKKIDDLDFSLMPDYIKVIYAQAMGYGILEFLLNDEDVDEIMVCTHNHIYAEKKGIPELTEYKFPSFEVAIGIASRIVRPLNKTLDVSNPNVDGQLQNGSRISASIPPLRAEGDISITIRKFAENVMPLMTYAEKYQSSTPEMVQFMENEFRGKKTTIVSGGTGSGKTTLLNSLSFALNPKERILVIEDTREIKIQQPHVEYYLKVPSTSEGFKGIEIKDIIQMALRKRPDRIIVGECRGAELNEFLNASNTGHEGSATSVHANNPEMTFSRMENMLLKNEETKNMTHEAIMRVLASAVDIIIQTNRLDDGTRKITNITEVLGYGEEGFNKLKKMNLTKPNEVPDLNKVYTRDIFYFKITNTEKIVDEIGTTHLKVHGQFLATGYIPFCNRELKRKGVGFDNKFFEKRVLLEV